MEIIKLNLIPSGVNPTCHAKQYDKGRTIRFELFNGLTPYTLQSGDTVTLNLRKPDNTIIEASVTATQGNKYVDLVTTEQMCAVAGYNLGTFKIVNGETDIGTLNFIMAVERDVLADGIASQSVIEDLDALVSEAVSEDLGDNYYTKSQTDSALDLKADISEIPTKTSDLQNDSGFAQIDDISEDNNKTWSAEKTNALVGEINNGERTYTKAQALSIFNKAESGSNVLMSVSVNKYGLAPEFANSSNAYSLLIPCKGMESIKYPLFKSTSNFGSGFLGTKGELINGYSETTSDTGTYKTEKVPVNAEIFVLSVSGDLAELDWSVTTYKIASVDELQKTLDNTVISKSIDKLSRLNYYTTSGDTFNWGMTYTVQDYGCIYDKCIEGDVYYITGSGGQSPRLWAFIDSNNNIISKANASASETNLKLVAPTNAVYVVFNVHTNQTWSIFKGATIEQKIDEKIALESTNYVAKNQGIAKAGKYLFVDENGLVSTTDGASGNSSAIYDGYLLKLASGEAVPVGEYALSYSDFISQTWDTLLSAFPSEVTKTTIINDSSNTYPIYKYVFAPRYYKKTVLLTAGMHGDEYEGFWGLFRLIKLIYTEGYKYPNLRKIRHDVRFIIIPILNPYGVQNKSRYNSQNIDANKNYGVYWDDPNYTHTGSAPFSSNEAKAVKIVADEYSGSINYSADFHTDPYAPSKGLYIEADGESPTYETAYNLTLDFRQILKDEYNYTAPLSQNFVVWENTVCSFFRYMEVIQSVPSNIVEVGVGGFSTTGSADTMKTGIEWYGNVVSNMVVKGLIVENNE